MNLQLEGKRALVTGSTAGIGFAIAEALANEGARVIINGRTRKRVDEALSKLKGDVEGVAAEGAVEVAARYPEVDILINNLGIFEPKPLAKSPTTTGGGFLK